MTASCTHVSCYDLHTDGCWWKPRDGAGSWEHTPRHSRTQLTLLGTFVVTVTLVLLFCAAVAGGHRLVCQMDRAAYGHGAHEYCSDFRPVTR